MYGVVVAAKVNQTVCEDKADDRWFRGWTAVVTDDAAQGAVRTLYDRDMDWILP